MSWKMIIIVLGYKFDPNPEGTDEDDEWVISYVT